jgi:hypothetical protein
MGPTFLCTEVQTDKNLDYVGMLAFDGKTGEVKTYVFTER